MSPRTYDAAVVGSGPNGLAAATTLAEAGLSVVVVEAAPTIGGGTRSAELVEPGYLNDVCSAVHPLGVGSPYLRSLPLHEHGLEWLHPEVAFTHPLDGGRGAAVYRSLDRTAEGFGSDGAAYRGLVERAVSHWEELTADILRPLIHVPRHPVGLARFGVRAVQPASWLARRFESDEARGALAGAAAHGILPLGRPLTGSFGLVFLASAHAVGWPVARGGSQSIADALASYLRSLGGDIRTEHRVEHWDDIPEARLVLFDVNPAQVAAIAEHRLPPRFLRSLRRFRHGPGAFKIDYTLDEPVPWLHEPSREAGTVHVGGTFAEVASAEADVAAGRHPEHPFLLVAQQSLVDPTRAPAGKHTLWVYSHVPAGSTVDISEAVERQLERFAPGFRDIVRGRHVAGPADIEAANPNMVGGDIAGGSSGGLQLIARPTLRAYRTPDPTIMICSASTPPGAGVHGMCGHRAALTVLR